MTAEVALIELFAGRCEGDDLRGFRGEFLKLQVEAVRKACESEIEMGYAGRQLRQEPGQIASGDRVATQSQIVLGVAGQRDPALAEQARADLGDTDKPGAGLRKRGHTPNPSPREKG